MKTILYSNFSSNILQLAELTIPNNEAYANRHGYYFRADDIPWSDGAAGVVGLENILELLETYDLVLAHGTDVLIMNHRIKATSLLQPQDHIVMAREAVGWWPINNDVLLLRSTWLTKWVIRRIIDASKEWLNYSMLWQSWIWNAIQDDDRILEAIRLVDPRLMNATHQDGASRWQLGDFIIHFLGYTLREKIIYAQKYLPLAGDPVFRALK